MLLCISSRACAQRLHISSLMLAVVRVFIPQKSANTVTRMAPPQEPVVKHLPAHHCFYLYQQEFRV